MNEFFSYYLLCFTGLFTVINPLGTMPVFATVAEYMDNKSARMLAWRVSVIALIALLFFAFTGQMLFRLFNISVDGLRVVGGIMLFIIGYDMLQAKVARTKALKEQEISEADEYAITPLAIPLVCGPGAITVTIVLYQEALGVQQKGTVIAALVSTLLLNFVVLSFSKTIYERLGSSANKVISRLMGLIIMMIAIEFFFTGLKPYVQKLIAS